MSVLPTTMEPFTSSFLLLLLVLSSILHSTLPAGLQLPKGYCSNGRNFLANSTYESNLRQLLYSVASSAPPSGFNASTISSPPNRIQALALCRGDLSADECKSCLDVATSDAEKNCPYAKSATIFYEKCHIRYSDQTIIGIVDSWVHCFGNWPNAVSPSDTERFNASARVMLQYLRNHVVNKNTSPPLFAAGQMEYGGSEGKIHGMVQCTRDISADQCGKCLDHIITLKMGSPVMCYNQFLDTAGLAGSCGFRYKNSEFLNSRVRSLVVPPQTSRDGGGEEVKSSGVKNLSCATFLAFFSLCLHFLSHAMPH